MSTDIDFDQFIKVLDAALVTDNQNVKKALRKFLFVAAMAMSDDDMERGPFTEMMETIDSLRQRVGALESANTTTTTFTDQTSTTPQWIYNPPYYGTSTAGNINISGGTGTSTTNTTTAIGSGTTTAVSPHAYSGSSCTGFTTSNTLGYTINLDLLDDGPKAEKIKSDIVAGLKKLTAKA